MLHMLHLSRTIHFWLELFIRQLEEASSKRSQMDVPSHTNDWLDGSSDPTIQRDSGSILGTTSIYPSHERLGSAKMNTLFI